MAIGGVVIQFLADSAKAVRDVGKLTTALGGTDTAADNTDRTLGDLQRGLDQAGTDARNTGGDLDTLATNLGDVQRELDEAGTDARNTGRDLQQAEDGFDDLGIASGQAATDLRNDVDSMVASIRQAGGDMDTETNKIATDLGTAGRESGAEFVGNIAEGIGSGQANLNDVVSGTLGGLTNLAATLTGPVGIAAGVAAAGIGVVFNTVKQQSEDAKQRVEELSGALEDIGDTSSAAAKQAIWDTWLDTMKKSPGELAKIVSGLETAGINGETFRLALVGSVDAQADIKAAQKKISDEIAASVRAGKPLTADQQTYLENQSLIIETINTMGGDLDKVEETQGNIKALTGDMEGNAEDWSAALKPVKDKTAGIKGDLDDIDGMTLNVGIKYSKKGSLIPPKAETPFSAPTPTGPTAGTRAAPTPIVVNVPGPERVLITEEQVYRAVSRLIARGDVRNGRPAKRLA